MFFGGTLITKIKYFQPVLLAALLLQGCILDKLEGNSTAEIFTEFNGALLTFQDARPGERFPLLVILHGAGETGPIYMNVWQEEAAKRRAMVLAPTRMRPYEGDAGDLEYLESAVDRTLKNYPIDPHRIWLAGVSSGGAVGRDLVKKHPERWKKVVLIASPPNENWFENEDPSRYPPFLFVHGRHDEQFEMDKVLRQAVLMKHQGFRVDVFEGPDGGHEHRPQWNRAIFDWLTRG